MYKCTERFWLEMVDGDGFTIGGSYFDVPEGSIWNIPEDKDHRFIGGEIRLESEDLGWIEIDKATLKNNFDAIG